MARITARNIKLFAGGRDISGRVNTSTLTFSSEAPEVSCYGDTYKERLSDGLRDYGLTFAGFGDFSASQIDETMQSLLSSSAWYGWYPEGATVSTRGREIVGVATDYSIEGAVAGAVGYSATITGCGVMLDMASLANATIVSSGCTNQSSVDFSTTNTGTCWHIYRILTLAGTLPDISASLQDSPDDITWTTLVEWGSASSACQIFAASSASSARYRRVSACLSGTSPSATFMVGSGSAK